MTPANATAMLSDILDRKSGLFAAELQRRVNGWRDCLGHEPALVARQQA